VGLKIIGTYQLLVCADGVNLLDDKTNAVKKNIKSAHEATKEGGPEVNKENTKCMLMSSHQNRAKQSLRQLIGPLKMRQSSDIWD
jgi:hypothetical protein